MTDSDSPLSNPTPAAHQALPLEELELTPQWVKTSGKSYADHSGGEREPRRDGPRPGRDRNRAPDRERRPRPERPAGAGDRQRPGPDRRRPEPSRGPVRNQPPRPVAPSVAPVEVVFQPEEAGFAAMMEAMKQTQRAYALFDVAKLVLNKPERHHVKFSGKPAADGTRAPLFLVMPSENVFLRQDEAIRFALRHHAAMIYREKKTPVDPPKGNFTFVNRCGFTGIWLGPPNYHEYQSRLIRHHQQRLRHIPFEEFRSRIQTVRDPEAIKAWVDSMSSKAEYECILDTEPKSFATRDELEKHFLENHVAQFVTSAPEVRVSGVGSRQLGNPALVETVRLAWLEERKFPMKTANEMRGKLRHEGFHFFKDPKGITFLGRIKPQRFESIGHLTEQIQKLIVYLREHVGCKRKQLIAHFVKSPDATVATLPPSVDVVAPPPDATTAAPPPSVDAAVPVPAPVADAVPPTEAPPVMPSEEDRVLADLHWLIQDGYVVEFSDGRLWALPDKPPQPVPVAKPAPTPEPAPAATETLTETIPAPPAAPVTETIADPAPTAESVQPSTDGVEPNPGTSAVS